MFPHHQINNNNLSYYNNVMFLLSIRIAFSCEKKTSNLHGRRMRVVSVRLELNGVPADLRTGGESFRDGTVRHSMGVSIGDNR